MATIHWELTRKRGKKEQGHPGLLLRQWGREKERNNFFPYFYFIFWVCAGVLTIIFSCMDSFPASFVLNIIRLSARYFSSRRIMDVLLTDRIKTMHLKEVTLHLSVLISWFCRTCFFFSPSSPHTFKSLLRMSFGYRSRLGYRYYPINFYALPWYLSMSHNANPNLEIT